MQKILDRTQASLAEAFASLARNAKRQQYLYLTAIVTLMAIVVFSAMLLGVLAANKQLDYRRSLVTQYAADISLLLHQEVSFLRRTELTIGYYRRTGDVRHLPDGVEASIRQTGVALCYAGAVGTRFDLLVAEATRNAWGSALNDKLLWLYWAGQSTLVTQQAFELDHRAMLVGLSEDYALILPAVESQAGGRAPRLTSADVVTLRETLQRELKAQTGRRVPAKDERLWVGPYVDPWLGVPVMTEVAAYYEGDVPTTLVTMSIPVGVLIGRLTRHRRMGTLLLLTDDRRVAVSSPPVSAALERELRTIAADLPDGAYRYTRHGAILREPIMPGFGSLVGYLPWGVLIAAIGWQLGAIAAVALCLLLGIALTARFWGLRLLRTTNDEAARALENEAINHVLVSATPTGLCIVRQSDYSILTANVHAGELLRVELSAGTLPAHVVGRDFGHHWHAEPWVDIGPYPEPLVFGRHAARTRRGGLHDAVRRAARRRQRVEVRCIRRACRARANRSGERAVPAIYVCARSLRRCRCAVLRNLRCHRATHARAAVARRTAGDRDHHAGALDVLRLDEPRDSYAAQRAVGQPGVALAHARSGDA
jgi:two-component system capsular synthesis sensor histidine kinase RcsC